MYDFPHLSTISRFWLYIPAFHIIGLLSVYQLSKHPLYISNFLDTFNISISTCKLSAAHLRYLVNCACQKDAGKQIIHNKCDKKQKAL